MTSGIERHRTAITRGDLSRPVRLLLGSGVFDASQTFFDYGCGKGEDVELLKSRGFSANGWDPHYASTNRQIASDFVAITYVINVIEDVKERAQAIRKALGLAKRALLISAQVTVAQTGAIQVPYADGILTGTGTFQKYFTQQELKDFIEQVTGLTAHPVGLGIFLLFRDESLLEEFEASRFRSRIEPRRLELTTELQEQLKDALEPLLEFYRTRGRFVKGNDERIRHENSIKLLGGMKRAERFVTTLLGPETETIRERREEDLLLFLAMARFQRRNIKMSALSPTIQNDIKEFFASLKKGNEFAEFLLFGLGEDGTIPTACRRAPFGKLLPDALYVHTDYIDRLPLVLRLFEGLASRYVGRVDGATLVKFSTKAPTISYLFYPDFDTDPHPVLTQSIRASLSRLEIEFTNYSGRANPPILHRKELFLPTYDPRYTSFRELTAEEVRAGLYREPSAIGTRDGWMSVISQTQDEEGSDGGR